MPDSARHRALSFLAALAAFALALLLVLAWAYWSTFRAARSELQALVLAVDQRSSQVREEGTLLGDRLLETDDCDRDRLRGIIANARYVRDVGRIIGTRIYCNAMDGSSAQIELGKPTITRQSDNLRLWISPHALYAARGNSFLRMDVTSWVDMPIPPDTVVAMMETESGRLYVHSAPLPRTLLSAAARLRHGELRQDGYLAMVSNSPDGRTTDVAARPLTAIHAAFQAEMPRTLAFGALLGSAFFALVLLLFRRHDTELAELRRALRLGKLQVALQPIVDVGTLETAPRVVGFECLARWTRDDGEVVPPDRFVPMIESAGLGSDLARCVGARMLSEFGATLRANPDIYVAFNLASADIADSRLLDDLSAMRSAAGILPSQVVIELTERTTEAPGLAAGLERLRRAGVRLSIDDFGTGASNASRLATFAPEMVKVDRSFLLHADTASHAAELLPQLVAMARGCGAKVVVEGVETPEQAQLLAGYGDVFGQGYYWHRPMPPAAAARLLQGSSPE